MGENMNVLALAQQELHVPKNQKNNFGGFSYRSCEDILEAFKPIQKKYGCYILLSDEIVLVGERYYVKATGKFFSKEGSLLGEAVGMAREPLSKKGSDESQITGSTSSYARKICLCGLLSIDDNRDPDSMSPAPEPPPAPKAAPVRRPENPNKEKEKVNGLVCANLIAAEAIEDLELKKKIVATINDTKFFSAQGQEQLGKRINEILDKAKK